MSTVVAVVVVTTLITSLSSGSLEATDQPVAGKTSTPAPVVITVERFPDPEPEPPRIRTCQVDPGVGLLPGMELTGSVALRDTGEVLWEVGADTPVVPASVLKLVTARAALRVLGPEFRFTTRVVAGPEPGEVWLVGGGDPTLTRTRPGSPTYYTDPAHLSDLVGQLVVAQGDVPAAQAFARVGIDSSRYDRFPQWMDTWRPNADTLGFVAPITALMVDGGRLAPAGRLAERTRDPVGQATTAFIRQLAEATGFWRSEVVTGVAPIDGRVIAQVASPPLTVLVEQMIRDSDNQIAEALLREVALALSVDSLDDAAWAALGVDTFDRDTFFADDGSGLSLNNTMTPGFVTEFLVDLVADPDMEVIVQALPTPGQPGSLLRRFSDLDALSPGISGKTGSLSGVRSLAGVIGGDDPLVYAVFVTGPRVDDRSRDLIDRLVVDFRACGENLAHWIPMEPGE